MDTSSEMIHAVLPAYMAGTLGISATVIGLIDGGAEASALFMKLFSGAISDMLGRRKALTLLGYGLAALSKPLFAFSTSAPALLMARLTDRVGKGIRGAPRDALITDLTPPSIRGAAFGLRQSLDTIGAFAGPALCMAMLLCGYSVQQVFLAAVLPAMVTVALLAWGIREPEKLERQPWRHIVSPQLARMLPRQVHAVILLGGCLTLARLSEAFLVLRAQTLGISLMWVPAVYIVMNLVYALGAYPFGRLADRLDRMMILRWSLLPLLAGHLCIAYAPSVWLGALGLLLWGIHMAASQGLLAAMLADAAPTNLRGTAFGLFNLCNGVVLLTGGAIAGLTWDHWGPAWCFYLGAAMTLLTAAIVWRQGLTRVGA